MRIKTETRRQAIVDIAREVFQEVDDALGQNLFRLMSEGPEAELTLTENAQPAIMANAIATLRVLENEGGIRVSDKAAYVAGQSLGHERHHAIGIGVGKKSQSSEVDGQDGNLAVMEQVHGMQHGAVAAEHDDQRQLPGQLRTHVTAPLVGAK